MGDSAKSNSLEPITRRGLLFLIVWALVIALLYSALGFHLSSLVCQYKTDALAQHQAWLDSGSPGDPIPQENPEGAGPAEVRTGLCVDRIAGLSIKDSRWTVDFYIWFKWTGDRVNPGENFQIVDGDIESKVKQDEWVNGQEHYVQYEVEAGISKLFNISRFPCDDHMLTIGVEDGTNGSQELRFVADARNSSVLSRVGVPGYEIYRAGTAVSPHIYPTNFGQADQDVDSQTTFSRFTYSLWIVRPGWDLYLKIFQSLFVAVAVSLLAFLIRPIHTSPRFSLGLGALFAAVANSYIVSSTQPAAGILTMADMATGLGILTIFLTLVQSSISLYIYDQRGKRSLSRLFDAISLAIFLAGYAAVNWTLLQAASIRY